MCDVVYVIGGNTDYLMYIFAKTGFDKVLRKLLESKVYVGSSAGSMIMSKRINQPAYRQKYGREKDFGVQKYFEFVDVAIVPHVNPSEDSSKKVEDVAATVMGVDFPVYALQDDSAVIMDNSTLSIIGNYAKL